MAGREAEGPCRLETLAVTLGAMGSHARAFRRGMKWSDTHLRETAVLMRGKGAWEKQSLSAGSGPWPEWKLTQA